MAGTCTMISATNIMEDFVATVTIPIGFQLVDNGIDPQNPYKCYISFDRNGVQAQVVPELHESIITIPDLNIPGATTTIDCMSTVNVVKLNGPLYYNAIISGFQPVTALVPTTTTPTVVSTNTAFSDSRTIQVSSIMAYGCYECEFPTPSIADYNITIIQHEEFLIDNHGNVIFNRPPSTQEFFNALKEGLTTQVINIPFTLVMSHK